MTTTRFAKSAHRFGGRFGRPVAGVCAKADTMGGTGFVGLSGSERISGLNLTSDTQLVGIQHQTRPEAAMALEPWYPTSEKLNGDGEDPMR